MAQTFTTYTGIEFDLENFDTSHIVLEDIIHSLNLQCRYNGHCKVPFSILKHSCLVQELMELKQESYSLQLYGIVHDIPEAYVSDIIKPLKNLLDKTIGSNFINDIEDKILVLFYMKYKLPFINDHDVLKVYDKLALRMEQSQLFDHKERTIDIPESIQKKYFDFTYELDWKDEFRRRFDFLVQKVMENGKH